MMMPRPTVVVGLGNPGREYAGTRHNLGAMVVEKVAEQCGVSFKKVSKFAARLASITVAEPNGNRNRERSVDLLLPDTYMNESGRAVYAYAAFFKAAPEKILVVVDDIAIPFGALRVRSGGSSGGHNGLKNIEMCLGTREYPRLRLGIGESRCSDLADHVLSTFSEEELKALPSFIEAGAKKVIELITS